MKQDIKNEPIEITGTVEDYIAACIAADPTFADRLAEAERELEAYLADYAARQCNHQRRRRLRCLVRRGLWQKRASRHVA